MAVEGVLREKDVLDTAILLGAPPYIVFLVAYRCISRRVGPAKVDKNAMFGGRVEKQYESETRFFPPSFFERNSTFTLFMSVVAVVFYLIFRWPLYLFLYMGLWMLARN